MDQRVFIAQLNIERYREKLLSEKEGATRRQIARLLAEEEAKLAVLSGPPGSNKEKDKSPAALASASGVNHLQVFLSLS